MTDTNDAPPTEPTEPAALIRTGADGRQRYSEDYKRRVLDAFAASGMSGKAFAAQCGVKYPTFASWLAKRRRKGDTPATPPAGGETGPDAPAFLLAEIGGEAAADALEVALPGGVTARAATPEQARLLAALITALR